MHTKIVIIIFGGGIGVTQLSDVYANLPNTYLFQPIASDNSMRQPSLISDLGHKISLESNNPRKL